MARGEARLTRDAILAAARAMVVVDGPTSLSMRRLATQLGVTAPALYLHFDRKDAIVAAIVEEEFGRLIEQIEAAASTSDDAIAQIKAQSHAYVACAVANPALFAVMFANGSPWSGARSDTPLVVKSWEIASLPIQRAIDQGRLREPDGLLAALTVWSAVHGVATLVVHGSGLTPPAEQRLVESVIDAVVDGLAHRGTA